MKVHFKPRYLYFGLAFVLSVLIVSTVIAKHFENQQTNKSHKNAEDTSNKLPVDSFKSTELIRLINKERAKNHTQKLQVNSQLEKAAVLRGNDMIINDYFDNKTSDPWSFVKKVNYSYLNLQSYIVSQQSTNRGVLNNLLQYDSKGLLSSVYTEIGAASVEGMNVNSPIVVLYLAKPSGNTTSSGYSGAGYKASGQALPKIPGCTYRDTPFKTEYVNVSYLNVGQTQVYGGFTGLEKICSSSTGGAPTISTILSPYNKTVYVGTGTPNTSPPSSPSYSYSQALSIAQNNCAPYANSSAYQQCVNAYLRKFGY